ncbi:MAG: hypothetical protein MJ072_01090, partial [Clostridia bacterium]|nr:hypothetical protein [Clostridia bacterium]
MTFREEMERRFDEKVYERYPIDKLTTYKIGGESKYFVVPKDEKSLIKTLETADKYSLPTFIIGKGSKILASDYGFDGVLVSTA